MKWFMWSIRSSFCKHDWDVSETLVEKLLGGTSYGKWERVSATCKKCGWRRKYWKF